MKTANRLVKIERTKNRRKYVYKDLERIMSRIINETVLTDEEQKNSQRS